MVRNNEAWLFGTEVGVVLGDDVWGTVVMEGEVEARETSSEKGDRIKSGVGA